MGIEVRKRKTARRGQGEGSIFQRADSRWCATVSVGYNQNGKRIQKSVYGKTKTEVQGKLLELQQRKKTGALTEASKVTVSQFLARWLDDVSRLTVRDSTHRRYCDLLRLHVYPRIGGVRLHRLTASDVQGVFATMEESGLSPRTRQFAHDVLKMAIEQAVTWGLIIRNVCDQVIRPKVQPQEMMVLDEKQAAMFLNAAKKDRLYAMYVLAVTTGMRQGELFALQWQAVDLEAGRLSVRFTLDKGTLMPPKTAKSRRQIKLPGMAVDALWKHKAAILAEGNVASQFVFCDTKGGALRHQNVIRRSFIPILKAAKLDRIRFHDLRHTAITLMLAQGINPKAVSASVGHATVAFTLDRYGHVLPSMENEAASRMDQLFKVAT